jgi:hypothetical protein
MKTFFASNVASSHSRDKKDVHFFEVIAFDFKPNPGDEKGKGIEERVKVKPSKSKNKRAKLG